jgi:type II secretory pathway component PulF
MNWRVTYRDKDAKQKTEFFEADSRHQLFAKLSELKINPIKIEQAENIKVVRKINIPSIALIVAALLVCVLSFCRARICHRV